MSRPRCSRCRRPSLHCLCALIPSLESRTQIVILQHLSEASHALNTARLAALGLRSAQLQIGERFDEVADAVPTYLLFPGEDAVPLSVVAHDDLPVRLIVPDGTWRKARKLLHLNPWLARYRGSRYRRGCPRAIGCARHLCPVRCPPSRPSSPP